MLRVFMVASFVVVVVVAFVNVVVECFLRKGHANSSFAFVGLGFFVIVFAFFLFVGIATDSKRDFDCDYRIFVVLLF